MAILIYMVGIPGRAEYVRVFYGDVSPRIIPDNITDEQELFLTDIFPIGWSGVDWTQLKGGEVVSIPDL